MTDSTTDSNEYRVLCQEAGGELASIHSEEENNFIVSLLRTKDARKAVWTWLGGKCSGSTCTWYDGSEWDYDNFGQGKCLVIHAFKNAIVEFDLNIFWMDISYT